MKTLVRQGQHYSNINIPKVWYKPTEISRAILFNGSMWYNPEIYLPKQDRLDINKLFGATWGFDSRKYSVRFGYVCSSTVGKVAIYAYVHDKDRDSHRELFLTTIDVYENSEHHFSIQPNEDLDNARFYVDGKFLGSMSLNFEDAKDIAVELDLYHGGTQSAPQDIHYEYRRIRMVDWQIENLILKYPEYNIAKKPTFYTSSIKRYPIFFVLTLLAIILYFSKDGIKAVQEHNEGTVWPLIYSLISWGYIIGVAVWFWANHIKVVKAWRKKANKFIK